MFKTGALGYVISSQKYIFCHPVRSQSCGGNPNLLTSKVVLKVLEALTCLLCPLFTGKIEMCTGKDTSVANKEVIFPILFILITQILIIGGLGWGKPDQ